MFQVFNGSRRGLGEDPAQSAYLKIDFNFREYLHHFKGARLAVFQAIALHANQEGWAWPSLALLADETGYRPETVSSALTDLCDMEIDGSRVLLAIQPRDEEGKLSGNRYLIFPSPEEITHYEGLGVVRKARSKVVKTIEPVVVEEAASFTPEPELVLEMPEPVQPKVRKPRTPKVEQPQVEPKAPSLFKQVQDAYLALPNVDIPQSGYARLGKAIKRYVQDAQAKGWADEEIVANITLYHTHETTRDQRQRQYWSGRMMQFETIGSQIFAWKKTSTIQATPPPPPPVRTVSAQDVAHLAPLSGLLERAKAQR